MFEPSSSQTHLISGPQIVWFRLADQQQQIVADRFRQPYTNKYEQPEYIYP